MTGDNALIINKLNRGGRIAFIDLAKGVCILLVVFLHTGAESYCPQILRMLRIPLYYVLSGIFFKDYGGYLQLLVKKTNKVLIPFVFFYTLSYLLRFALLKLSPGLLPSGEINFLEVFYSHTISNQPIWFLVSLFWCHLMFCGISLTIKREVLRAVAVIVIGGAGAVLGRFQTVLPCFLDCSMTSLPFFYLGYLLKRVPLLYPNKADKYNAIFAVALFAVSLLVYYFCGEPYINFAQNQLPYCWPIVMCGCATFVLAVLLLCKMIGYIPFVSYLGRYSIIVLCVHMEIFVVVSTVLRHIGIDVFPAGLVVTLLVSWGCIPLFVKYLPYVTAQKDLIVCR